MPGFTPRNDAAARIIALFNTGREGGTPRASSSYQACASPLAFLRSSAHLFWEDWPTDRTLLDDAPRTWSCGDLHIENFGTYRGDNRLTYFDINDFDEAALAPKPRDLVRLLTSMHVAARGLRLSTANAGRLCDVHDWRPTSMHSRRGRRGGSRRSTARGGWSGSCFAASGAVRASHSSTSGPPSREAAGSCAWTDATRFR